jgi:hypothetical protein
LLASERDDLLAAGVREFSATNLTQLQIVATFVV